MNIEEMEQVIYRPPFEELDEDGLKTIRPIGGLPDGMTEADYMKHLKGMQEVRRHLYQSILHFKDRDAFFIRSDGQTFTRRFEPCVHGRIWDWREYECNDGVSRKMLVFQTDRGFWIVPCRRMVDLNRMVIAYDPETLTKMLSKSFRKRGMFYDQISGYNGDIRVDKDTNEIRAFRDGKLCEVIDPQLIRFCQFPEHYRAATTPYEKQFH
jgi:hypothetical protein